jgi:hypothetical protein
MVSVCEQISRENLQRIRDLTEPSPLMRSMLDQIEFAQRSEKLARAMGFAFPEGHQIQKESL